MGDINRRVFLLFILFVLAANVLYATEIVNVPLDHPVYNFIDRMVVRGVIPKLPTRSLPLTRGAVEELLRQISHRAERGEVKLTASEEVRLRDLLPLFANDDGLHLLQTKGQDYDFRLDLDFSQEFVISKGEVKASSTSLRPAVMGSIKENFAFAVNVPSHVVIGEQEYYSYNIEHPYGYTEDVSGNAIINTYMKFRLPWFEVQLGKDNLWWGPGRYGSLLISDNPPSWDMLKLDAAYSIFRFTYFTGILPGELGDRYLSGHRLEALITPGFRFGIHETVVHGNRFERHYLNPFTIYFFATPTLEASGINDNMLIGLDFEILPLKNVKLYGELMVDDFQSPWDLEDFYNWANLFGIQFGVYWTNPLGLDDTDLRAEYTFVNQYSYTHWIPTNSYQHYGHVIGHWLGPDADYLKCDFSRYITDRLSFNVSYALERHGEGDMGKSVPPPGESKWHFLSGITERRDAVGVKLSYGSLGRYLLSVAYEYASIQNMENKLDRDLSSHTIRLMCSLGLKR